MLGIEPDPRKAAAQRKTARKLAFPSCVSRTEILVRLAGIEPTTPWFVAKYSIQLSYSREALHYSMAFCFCRKTFKNFLNVNRSWLPVVRTLHRELRPLPGGR